MKLHLLIAVSLLVVAGLDQAPCALLPSDPMGSLAATFRRDAKEKARLRQHFRRLDHSQRERIGSWALRRERERDMDRAKKSSKRPAPKETPSPVPKKKRRSKRLEDRTDKAGGSSGEKSGRPLRNCLSKDASAPKDREPSPDLEIVFEAPKTSGSGAQPAISVVWESLQRKAKPPVLLLDGDLTYDVSHIAPGQPILLCPPYVPPQAPPQPPLPLGPVLPAPPPLLQAHPPLPDASEEEGRDTPPLLCLDGAGERGDGDSGEEDERHPVAEDQERAPGDEEAGHQDEASGDGDEPQEDESGDKPAKSLPTCDPQPTAGAKETKMAGAGDQEMGTEAVEVAPSSLGKASGPEGPPTEDPADSSPKEAAQPKVTPTKTGQTAPGNTEKGEDAPVGKALSQQLSGAKEHQPSGRPKGDFGSDEAKDPTDDVRELLSALLDEVGAEEPEGPKADQHSPDKSPPVVEELGAPDEAGQKSPGSERRESADTGTEEPGPVDQEEPAAPTGPPQPPAALPDLRSMGLEEEAPEDVDEEPGQPIDQLPSLIYQDGSGGDQDEPFEPRGHSEELEELVAQAEELGDFVVEDSGEEDSEEDSGEDSVDEEEAVEGEEETDDGDGEDEHKECESLGEEDTSGGEGEEEEDGDFGDLVDFIDGAEETLHGLDEE